MSTGVVTSTSPATGSATLVADVLATATVLPVDDAAVFAEDFTTDRFLVVGDETTPRQYVAVQNDEELGQESVTLVATVGGSGFEAGLPVTPWDPDSKAEDKRAVEHSVWVLLDGQDGTIRATVPHAMIPVAGIDSLIGAHVRVEETYEDSGDWQVAYVFGREAVVDGRKIDPTTLPDLGGGVGQTFSEDPPSATTGFAEDHAWWQVVGGEVVGFWRMTGGAWVEAAIVKGDAAYFQNALIEALQVTGLSAVTIDGGSIYIAEGAAGAISEGFSGTAFPAGWTSTKTAYDGSPLSGSLGSAVPGASVVSTGPSGQVGSALLVDFGPADVTDSTGNAGGSVTIPLPTSADGELSARFRLNMIPEGFSSASEYLILRSTGSFLSSGWDAVGFNLIPYQGFTSSNEAKFEVVSVDNGVFTRLATITVPRSSVTGWCRARLKVQAGVLYAKVWQDGATEPAWTTVDGAAIPAAAGSAALVWRQSTTLGSDGQKVHLDQLDGEALFTGFKVNPDGTGEWPAIGIGAGDATWRTVSAAGQPAFQNGWTATSGDSIQFRKSATGDVALVGRAAPGTSNAAVFTLPDTHCPSRDLTDIIVKAQGTGASGVMDILANGQVVLRAFNTSTWVSVAWAFPSN